MKKSVLIISCCLCVAGLSLAQSDSAKGKPDSVKVSVEVQNAGNDAAMVTVTTEKGKTDSTVTVSINSGPKQDKRTRRRNWVLGCRMPNLEFKNFPGAVFLQRRAGRLGYAGLGFRYTSDQSGPDESYSQHDSSRSKGSSSNWSMSLNPEYVFTRAAGGWIGSVAVRGIYEYSKWVGTGESVTIGDTYSSTSRTTSQGKQMRYGVELPVAIERRFRIGRMVFSAGLAGQFISVSAARSSNESTNEGTYTWGVNTTSYSNRQHSKNTDPVHFAINSPFNGSASIQLKYWF